MASRRSPAATSPVSLKLSDEERERLTTLATARKRSSHYLMREAVREYLTREELRQAFADEAEKAWLDYEQTGLHVRTPRSTRGRSHLRPSHWGRGRGERASPSASRNGTSSLFAERCVQPRTASSIPGREEPRRGSTRRQRHPRQARRLARFPRLGPADPDRPDTRQLFIRFGAAGYVARYRVLDDTVTVLAVRHMREAWIRRGTTWASSTPWGKIGHQATLARRPDMAI